MEQGRNTAPPIASFASRYEVAIIPKRERHNGRFVYHSVSEPVETVDTVSPAISEAFPENAWEE